MDLTDTLTPNSAQLDAVDLATSGPRTFSIERVTKGNSEQPVNIHLAEFPRPWRPSKGMRQVLATCWGVKTDEWPTGAQVRLFCDTSVRFGGIEVGGVRIAGLSHIDGPKKVPLIITRGKSEVFTVQPITVAPAAPAQPAVDVETERAIADLTAEWHAADTERRAAIEAEVASLRGGVA